jgi:hypothetical protein
LPRLWSWAFVCTSTPQAHFQSRAPVSRIECSRPQFPCNRSKL